MRSVSAQRREGRSERNEQGFAIELATVHIVLLAGRKRHYDFDPDGLNPLPGERIDWTSDCRMNAFAAGNVLPLLYLWTECMPVLKTAEKCSLFQAPFLALSKSGNPGIRARHPANAVRIRARTLGESAVTLILYQAVNVHIDFSTDACQKLQDIRSKMDARCCRPYMYVDGVA